MDSNPYAPPKAAVADVIPTGLKRRSVLLMLQHIINRDILGADQRVI